MKINNFQGELTDISAKKEALVHTLVYNMRLVITGDFILADVSVRSLQKLIVYITQYYVYRINRHGVAQYTEDLEFIFYGYHLDRAIPIIQRPYIV